MNSSWKLLVVRGIDIRIHLTFPLILILAAMSYGQAGGVSGAVFGIVSVLFLFVLVTLHELGHSFAALHYGIAVRQIVLLPIGGLAQLERMPEKPHQEFMVAVAGPAVNVVLAVVMGLIAWLLNVPFQTAFQMYSLTFTTLFSFLLVYNVILAVFNLLPAFPMDGGRMLRALLAMWLRYEQATAIAVNIGRFVAILMGLWAIINGAIFMGLIALFIFVSGSQELAAIRWQNRLRRSGYGHAVRDVFSPVVGALGPYDSLRQALAERMRGRQSDFPVADDGRYIGFVTEDGLLRAANLYGPDALIYAAMSPDVRPVPPHADLLDVMGQMARLRVWALPVVEYGRLLGMITYRQIQEFIQSTPGQPHDDTPRIVGA
ncbi:MAG: protease [Chloroflexota bacterium]|nr:site-2 protease family protein [Ardenticatenaceae bacterium]GIK57482.1 MAG: protease [Chloroflexota bacterium]